MSRIPRPGAPASDGPDRRPGHAGGGSAATRTDGASRRSAGWPGMDRAVLSMTTQQDAWAATGVAPARVADDPPDGRGGRRPAHLPPDRGFLPHLEPQKGNDS